MKQEFVGGTVIECVNKDCLEHLPSIPDKYFDLILCDLPYFYAKSCKWDLPVPLDQLWPQLNRIAKDNAPIVHFGSQPFTSMLVMSNLKNFKYEWIWQKDKGSNFVHVKRSPFKEHENIVVFGTGREDPNYFPIMEARSGNGLNLIGTQYYSNSQEDPNSVTGPRLKKKKGKIEELRYPKSVQKFNRETGWFATQKPVSLLEYLIKTYSKEGDTVLDPTGGSFSTAIACYNLKRNCLCIEKDEDNFNNGTTRLQEEGIFEYGN